MYGKKEVTKQPIPQKADYMSIVAIQEVIDKLPLTHLQTSLHQFLEPLSVLLPDARLGKVAELGIAGIVAAQSPLISQMGRMVPRDEASTRAASARFYRFVHNPRVGSKRIFKGLYHCARQTIATENPPYLVVALDPVNFEKPYTTKLAGVSTVHKATPPNERGKARLARGYPAMTACVVNTRVPAITYANWFSYKEDFISQNRELWRSVRLTRAVAAGRRLRFVADAGFDDQKIFEWFRHQDEFVIRLSHLERLVEVYNERTGQWEAERLKDLVHTVLWQGHWQVEFNHAGKRRQATIAVGYFKIRLPATQQELGIMVAEEEVGEEAGRRIVLGTNVPLSSLGIAQKVYEDWRLRGRIEAGYRFDQEAGLDVEKLAVQDLEAMRCVFGLVLLAAQFVFYLLQEWPPAAVMWVRELGGKVGTKQDRDGPYIFLQGLVALYQSWLALSFVRINPFPHSLFAQKWK